MKKTYTIFLLTSVLFLSGCSYKVVKEEQNDQKDIFDKKQECAKYRVAIEQELENDMEYSLERKLLDEIFFSPSENSCLYSYTSYYIDANGIPMNKKVMGTEYAIKNFLTNETILSGNSVINTEIANYYIQRKNELKKQDF